MAELKLPRLLGAAKEFNIGQDTLIDFLIAKGFGKDDLKPTSKLTEEMYRSLQQEFQSDKVAKAKSDQIDLPKGGPAEKKKKDEKEIVFRKEEKPAAPVAEVKPAKKEEVPVVEEKVPETKEKEVVKDSVTGQRNERHIPKQVEPRNNLVGHERIAPYGLVINDQTVDRIEDQREIGWYVKWFALIDQDDEQRGGPEYDTHAGNQSEIYPLFGEWVVRRTWFFFRLLIQQILPGGRRIEMICFRRGCEARWPRLESGRERPETGSIAHVKTQSVRDLQRCRDAGPRPFRCDGPIPSACLNLIVRRPRPAAAA